MECRSLKVGERLGSPLLGTPGVGGGGVGVGDVVSAGAKQELLNLTEQRA